MKARRLGSSDLTVSEICLGTMTYGEQNTEKEAHEQQGPGGVEKASNG